MFSFSTMLGMGILETINNAIGRFFYGLFGSFFFRIIDWIQHMFRSLAGLDGGIQIDGVNVGDGGIADYDIVYYLISSDIIKEIFISMIIFSFFLLIIMTVLALIRNQYQEKQKAPTAILGKMFTAMVNTIIFTAFVILGLMFSNVLLQIVDKGTSFGNSEKVTTTLFMSMSYDANKLRIDNGLMGDDYNDALKEANKDLKKICQQTNFATINSTTISYCTPENFARGLNANELNELADILDDAFCQGKIIKDGTKVLSPANTWETEALYNLWECNYLIVIIGGCFIIAIYVKMCWGLVGRLFKLCFDFVLIPVVHAMLPFDEGASLKSLKGDVVKNITMAYAPVASLNLYFSILPIINKVKFTFSPDGFLSYVAKLALSLIGLYSMQSLTKIVNGWFGTGDVLGEGEATFKTLKDAWKSGTGKISGGMKKVTGAYGGIVGGVKTARDQHTNAFMGAMRGFTAGSGLDKTLGLDNFSISKGLSAGRKAGSERVESQALEAIDLSPTGKTPRADRKKNLIELAKFNDKFEKQLKALGDPSKPEVQKAITKAKAESEIITKLAERGGEMIVDGNPMSIATANEELKALQSDIDKITGNKNTVNTSLDAQNTVNSYEQIARQMGLTDDQIRLFLNGKTVTIDGVESDDPAKRATLSDQQLSALQQIKTAQENAKSSATDALLALFRNSKEKFNEIFNKELGDTKSMDESELLKVVDDKAYTLFTKHIKDVGDQVDGMTAKIRTTTAELNTKTKKYTEAKAEAYDSLVKNGKDDINIDKLKF